MGDINQIVNVQISAQSNSPSRENFGIPAIYVYHNHYIDRIRTYIDQSGLTSDGFSSTEPGFLMVSSLLQQNPRPPAFKVIRCTTAVVQTMTFTVTDNTNGDVVGLSLLGPDGVLRDFRVTVGASQTTTQVATALAAVIDAAPDLSATSSAAVITITGGTAGETWYPSLVPFDSTAFAGGFRGGIFADTTPTVNPAADLDATLQVDKDFYGISSQFIGATNIQALASWAESNKRIFSYVSADSANLTAGTGIFNTLKGLSYNYSHGGFSQTPYEFWPLGLMANRFTADPGTDTWAYKNVVGEFPDDNLTPTQLLNLETNNGNYYTTTGGLKLSYNGRAASGQFMDLTRGLDALAEDMRVEVFGLIASLPRLPYTSRGLSAIAGAMEASLARFTATDSEPSRLLSNDPGFQPKVLVPNLKNISSSDKKNRILRSMNWTATATGGIQKVFIQGTVNF